MHNFWVLILGTETEQKGWNNEWYGNSPSSPTGLFIADLLLPCVKKINKNSIFKPAPIPKIFGNLIKH